jgi:hypothetical protein
MTLALLRKSRLQRFASGQCSRPPTVFLESDSTGAKGRPARLSGFFTVAHLIALALSSKAAALA